MIGDSERDIQAGINAGCITIGVRTGYGIKKTKHISDLCLPIWLKRLDFIVDDPYRLHLMKYSDDLRITYRQVASGYSDWR